MNDAKRALLEALSVERQTSPWWTTPKPQQDDAELTTARRRRVLEEATDTHERTETA